MRALTDVSDCIDEVADVVDRVPIEMSKAQERYANNGVISKLPRPRTLDWRPHQSTLTQLVVDGSRLQRRTFWRGQLMPCDGVHMLEDRPLAVLEGLVDEL